MMTAAMRKLNYKELQIYTYNNSNIEKGSKKKRVFTPFSNLRIRDVSSVKYKKRKGSRPSTSLNSTLRTSLPTKNS